MLLLYHVQYFETPSRTASSNWKSLLQFPVTRETENHYYSISSYARTFGLIIIQFPVTLFYKPLKQTRETTLLPPKRTLNIIRLLHRKMLTISTYYKPIRPRRCTRWPLLPLQPHCSILTLCRLRHGVLKGSDLAIPWFRHTKALSQEKIFIVTISFDFPVYVRILKWRASTNFRISLLGDLKVMKLLLCFKMYLG